MRARRSARRTVGVRWKEDDVGRSVSGQTLQQPERFGLSFERGTLFHRSAIWLGRQKRRSEKGAALQWCLSPQAQWRSDFAHGQVDLPQRSGFFARRKNSLCGGFRSEKGNLDDIRREGGRHHCQWPDIL